MECDYILEESLVTELMVQSLKKGDEISFRALGSSMFPIIMNGDIVTIKYFNQDKLSIGDLLFFEQNNSFFLHRLIKKNIENSKTIFITKGDFMPSPDPAFKSNNILGKLISIKRNNKIIRMDTTFYHVLGIFIAFFHPITYPLSLFFIKNYHLILRLLKVINLGFNRWKLFRKLKKNKLTGIKYQKASSDDFFLISQFYNTEESLLHPINGNSFYIIAKYKNRVVASANVAKSWENLNNSDWWIMSLEVKPHLRGSGIGEKIVLTAISELKKEGIKEIFINMFENNKVALNLYQKIGFRQLKSSEIERKINKYYHKVSPESSKTIIYTLHIN